MYFNNLINKIKLPFRKDKELYRRLYAILGFYPNDISLYKQALMHKSVNIKSKDGRRQDNERLEFLGDAILDAIVGDIVYRHFEGKREGFLTNTRSKLVQRETLGKLAVEMGLDKLIQSSHSRHQSHNSYLAGNAFEALVGAIYLDYGYEQCMKFMEKRILGKLVDIDKVAYKEVNFKSKLLEWSQKNRIHLNFKDTEKRSEKDGSTMFYTLVVIEGLDCGRGQGYSKKESQQNAARESLLMLKKEKGMEERVFEAKSQRTAMEEQPEALLPDIPEDLLKLPQTSAEGRESKRAERSEKKAEQPAKQEQPKQKKPKQEKPEKPAKQESQKPAKEEQSKQKKLEKPAKEEQPAKQEQSKPAKQEQPVEADPKAEATDQQEADKPARKPRRRKPANKSEQKSESVEEKAVQEPAEQKSAEQTPAEQKPTEQTPAEQTPAEQTPVEEPSSDQPSAEEAPRKKSRRGHRRPARALGEANTHKVVEHEAAPTSDTSSKES